MSERKYSEYRLQREREEKLRLLGRISSLQGELGALKQRVSLLLESASEGLRSTFAKEVAAARDWLSGVRMEQGKSVDMDVEIGLMQKVERELDRQVGQGRSVQESLTVAFTQKADAMGQELAQHIAKLEQRYLSGKQLLELWLGEQSLREWEEKIIQLRRLLDEEQYGKLQTLVGRWLEELAKKITWAEEEEEKHQKRLYLLKALRQVCADMGFGELSPPQYEREGERGSRILLTVDTYDRGKIEFALSLDRISTFSEIAHEKCFEEFDQLSQFLEEGYGIQTEFKREDGTRPPKLIRKGEKDLPGDAAMQAHL